MAEFPADVPKEVLDAQAVPVGQRLLHCKNGFIEEFFHDESCERAERFARLLDAELNWVESFVSHSPTIGSHHENILRDLLAEYLPSSVRVGTGFCVDSITRRCSPQTDIIVYSDRRQTPIHRRGEFVVLDSSTVIGACEVKKALKPKDLRDFIRKTVGVNYGRAPVSFPGVQVSGLFAFSSATKTETLAQIVIDEMNEYAKKFIVEGSGQFAMFHIALPAIYLRDRQEFITTCIAKDKTEAAFGRLSVHTLKTGGANGISPLLASMDPEYRNSHYRDFVTSFLSEVVKIDEIETPVVIKTRLSTREMEKRYPDLRTVLQNRGLEQVAFAASIPSVSGFEQMKSAAEVECVRGFKWVVHPRPLEDGDFLLFGPPENDAPSEGLTP